MPTTSSLGQEEGEEFGEGLDPEFLANPKHEQVMANTR